MITTTTTAADPAALPAFTSEQLAAHNTDASLWVAIRGMVYDVTQFANRHPGGKDMLRIAAGRDATQMFEMYHPLETSKLLSKFRIGRLVSARTPTFPEPSVFHRTIKQRVELEFFKTRDLKNHLGAWIRYAVVFASLLVSYYLQFYSPVFSQSLWLQIPLAVILGFACAQIGLNPLHDGTHCAITRSPLVWTILGSTHDFFNGTSHLIWIYQHVVGHHPFTNITGADPDITTDIRRVEEQQRWSPFYRYQAYFIPVAYGLLALKFRLSDIKTLYITKSMDGHQINPPPLHHHLIFWGGKLFWAFYRVVLPLAFGVPLSTVLILLVVSDLVSSYWLSFTFQANHVVDDVLWPHPDKGGQITMDWAEMQVQTTLDYAHESWFWTSTAGALNYQAVHHLFPGVNQHWYPAILDIVKETCKEFNIKYIIEPSFNQALRKHLSHLDKMGQEPKGSSKRD
ncbi:delta5 fatty acid desaturase [Polychytrium aggregatum]|uniref:delta5 fatty acid desaturase n=1 Tax=Polychytrium aggregatum TaxID=110093 RepID=UPI0022FF3044|nr:delta5 fatty acid desaturase [Polychytrium aggregatum]KAI9199497.1 delta5 fatty acid desaturase [Polychytrium aggregatum]